VHGVKHWYIDCKECGRGITLETYTGNHAAIDRPDETLRCPTCHKESIYSGDDFKTAKLF